MVEPRPSGDWRYWRVDYMSSDERGMKTGMEPWFEFWEAVRYAIEQIRIEWANHKAYMRTGDAS